MDGKHFDSLMISLAEQPSRRGALRLLAGSLLGGTLGWLHSEESSAGNARQKCQKKRGEAKKRCLKKLRKREGEGSDGGGGCPAGSATQCCQCNTTACSLAAEHVADANACQAFCSTRGGGHFLEGVMGNERKTCERGSCGNVPC